jgi:hypothetical protein
VLKTFARYLKYLPSDASFGVDDVPDAALALSVAAVSVSYEFTALF